MKLVVLACLLGLAVASPRPQYSNNAPPAPANLYERPKQNNPRPQPPKRPQPPPRRPEQNYGPPKAEASNNNPQTQDAPQAGMEGMPYELDWGVDDEESGNSYSHVESSDGQTTRGEYRVLLPDGRTQVVTFFDDGNGYNAEVTYE